MQKLFIIAAACAIMTGCATIIDGRPDSVNVMTSDGGSVNAQVLSKSGVQTVVLPTVVTLPKSCRDVTIQVMPEGKVKSSFAVVNSSVNPWVFGNIIFGGIIGAGVDGLTGAICTYDNAVVVPIIRK